MQFNVFGGKESATKGREREGEKEQKLVREDPRINLASELTRKGTCPLRFALLRFLRGPTGPSSGVAVAVAAGVLESGGKCHRTRKQLLRPGPSGPFGSRMPST